MPGEKRANLDSSGHDGDSHRCGQSVSQSLGFRWWAGASFVNAGCRPGQATSRFIRFPEAVGAHHQLTALPGNQTFALQPGQLFGDSGSRGSNQIGELLVAQNDFQQRAARFLDSEIRT